MTFAGTPRVCTIDKQQPFMLSAKTYAFFISLDDDIEVLQPPDKFKFWLTQMTLKLIVT